MGIGNGRSYVRNMITQSGRGRGQGDRENRVISIGFGTQGGGVKGEGGVTETRERVKIGRLHRRSNRSDR